MMKSMLKMLAAVLVTCGVLATAPGAAGAAQPEPSASDRHPGPPVPRYEPRPRFWESSVPRHRPPGPEGPGAARPGQDRRGAEGGTPSGPPAEGTPSENAAQAVVRLVNGERERAGCPALRPHRELMRAARGHSRAMAGSGRLSHYEPDGTDVSDRMAEAGYAYREAAENVTSGAPDAEAAVRSWMESPGHRRHIVNCAFEDVGVGVSFASGGPWWTLLLGAPR